MGLRSGRSLLGDLARAARHPGLALSYLRRWKRLARFAEIPYDELKRFRRELVSDDEFNGHIERNRGRALGGFGRAAELYVVVRALRPEVVVETGVASGVSSAHILKALSRNDRGRLHSIDLPNVGEGVHIPEGRAPGWIVPDNLRSRWHLQLGDSRELLPKLLNSVDRIDIFFHDSDHSYENMMFEFEEALPKLCPGGLILSDDTNYNRAFDEFCAKHRLACRRVVHMGVTRRP